MSYKYSMAYVYTKSVHNNDKTNTYKNLNYCEMVVIDEVVWVITESL